MYTIYPPSWSAQQKMVAIWSPYPFENFFRYQNLFQKFLQAYPQLLGLECRYGQSLHSKRLLEHADLVLLLLEQSADCAREIILYPFLYHKAVFPVICNYRHYCGPGPEELARQLRLYHVHPCVLPDTVFRKKISLKTPESLCVREHRGFYGLELSDAELCRQTFCRLRLKVDSMLS